jgi:WD40 repeat protein
VFRDESALSANPHLWSSIQDALDRSEWFVLLASPESVASPWVNRELEYWLGHKSADRILPVVTDGTWAWTDEGLRGTAVSPALRSVFGDEPRHVDLCWAHDVDDIDLHNSHFRDAVAQLAAPVHGIAKDELEGEDVRLHRRARRLARSAIGALLVLVVVSLSASGIAIVQRRRADRQAAVARREADAAFAAQLVTQARALPADQFDVALLLAIQARHLQPSDTTDGALEAALLHGPPGVDARFAMGPYVCALALSPNGRFVVTSTSDGRLLLTDRRLGSTRALLQVAKSSPCVYVTWSRDSTRLLTVGPGGTAVVWDPATARAVGVPIQVQSGPTPPFNALMTRRDRVVTTTTAGTVVVWDTSDPNRPKRTARFDVPSTDTVWRWVWLADATNPDRIAIGDTAQTQVWNLATHTMVYPPLPGDAIGESPDGKTLVTRTATQYRLWDVATGRARGVPLPNLTPPTGFPEEVAFSPNGARLAVVDGRSNSLRFVDLATGRLLSTSIRFLGPSGGYPGGFLADNSLSVYDQYTLTAALWHDVTAPAPFATVLGTHMGLGAAIITPDASRVLALTANGVTVFDMQTGMRTSAPPGGPYSLESRPVYSTDGRLVASPSRDGSVNLFDAASGRRVGIVPVGAPYVGLAWSPHDHVLAAVNGRGEVTLWNVGDPARPTLLSRTTAPDFPKQPIPFATFSPDGRTLAVQGQSLQGGSTISLVDALHGTIRALRGASVIGIPAYSPDSHSLAAADATNHVVVWDTTTGTVRATLTLPYQAFGVAYVDGGRWLAASELNSTATVPARLGLWNPNTGLSIGEPIPVPGDAAILSPDQPGGTLLATGTTNPLGGTDLWDLNPDHWEAIACRLAGRNLTRAEWNTYLPQRPYQATCPQWPDGA